MKKSEVSEKMKDVKYTPMSANGVFNAEKNKKIHIEKFLKRKLVNILFWFVPVKSWRKKLREEYQVSEIIKWYQKKVLMHDNLIKFFFKINAAHNKKINNIKFNKIYTVYDCKGPLVCTSQLCNQEFFALPLFQYWTNVIKEDIKLHRKLWEFIYVIQALYENNCLETGKKGLGFGVGTEPLPALFASMGCKILATDLNPDEAKEKGWVDTNQHIGWNKSALNDRNICPSHVFEKNVEYQNLNMNEIPDDLTDFDFNWSSCALEHIGGLEKSCDFFIDNLKTLKSGGIAVHTTEFNLSSNEDTSLDPNCVILRERDIKKVADKLTKLGHYVYPLNLRLGTLIADNYVDTPPYKQHDVHLRLMLDRYVTTSFGLIVRKNG